MWEFFTLTFKAIRFRPLRSWLTVLGVIIGVILVVIILCLGSGIKNSVGKLLQMFGSDYIIIFPGKETNPFAGIMGGQRFRDKDLEDLEQISVVNFVLPMDVASMNLEFEGEKKTTMIHGGPWKEMREVFEASQGMKVEKGEWPTDDQADDVIVGYLVANEMFQKKIDIGDSLIIKSKRMRVAGILARIGVQDDDNSVYLSLNRLRSITGISSGAITAFIKTTPGANLDIIARQVRSRLEQQEVVRDFSVLTPEKVDRLAGGILSLVELVFMALGLISLLVGAVGIMNSTYTSVLERTKQIGVMKAIGASNEHILSLFLIESGLIGLSGGIIGIIIGIALSFMIGVVASQLGLGGLFSFASLDYFGFLAVLAFTFVVGIISGILPARQAARLDPAEALRYE
jgi:putative ABC transport system permease protein